MHWMIRRIGYKAAALLGAMVLLGAPGAFAVSIPSDVYTLPVDASRDPVTVNLGAPAPFPGFPEWIRLRPDDPTDTMVDYEAFIKRVVEVDTPGRRPGADDVWTYDITFAVSWAGTIDEATPPSGTLAKEMLFVILDSRFETEPGGATLDTTRGLGQSGIVRRSAGGKFRVNGQAYGTPQAPEIVRDDAVKGGFVNDGLPDDWLGFYLPAIPTPDDDDYHTVKVRWALGQRVDMSGDLGVFFPNALFVAAVPEPSAAVLMTVGILLLGLGGLRQRAG